MPDSILDFYRSHRAQIDVMADGRSLFLVDFLSRVSPTIRGLQTELGWTLGDVVLICERLAEAGLVTRALDLQSNIELTQKGKDLLRVLWTPTADAVDDATPDQCQSESTGSRDSGLPLDSRADGNTRDGVFISYSHKDRKFLHELRAHLKPLESAARISVWSDKQISPGSIWLNEIEHALEFTKVAVLLVTKDFLASDFIHEHELGPLLRSAEQGGVRILWVLVRACSYAETSIKNYHAAFPPDKPLAEMKAERDKAWVKICEAIKSAMGRQ